MRLFVCILLFFFFSSRRRHTRFKCDWSSDVCSSDLYLFAGSRPVSKSVVVPHSSRWTEDVNADLTTSPTSNFSKIVSTVVSVKTGTACQGVVAERPLYFTNFAGMSSGSDVLGVTHTVMSFSFADIPTVSGYNTFIAIWN